MTRPGTALPPFRDPSPPRRRRVGKVVSVGVDQLGGSLQGDHSAGDAELFLDDVTDFEAIGGHLTVDDTRLVYDGLSRYANTISLANPLDDPHQDGTWVAPCHGETIPTQASAEVDLGLGDTVQAIIPHALRPLLPPGNRKPREEESVRVVNHGDPDDPDWWVADVFGQAPHLPFTLHWTHLAPLDTSAGLPQHPTHPGHITGVRLQVHDGDEPSSDLTADVLLNGTSIFDGTLPTIPAGSSWGGIAVADYVPFAVDDFLRGQITDTGGSSGPLLMQIECLRGL